MSKELNDAINAPSDKQQDSSKIALEATPIKVRMKAMSTGGGGGGGEVDHSSSIKEMPPPPIPQSTQKGVPPPSQGFQSQLSVDEYLEKTKPVKYQIGDLIWAKLTGHPWWPCMVTEDPLQKVHTKLTGKGQRTYHCQFFGNDAERSWVTESATLRFEGREAFLQFVEKMINAAGTKAQRKQACQKYEIRASKKQAWNLSAMAADQAMQLDVEERKRVYTFQYRDLPENQSSQVILNSTSQPTKNQESTISPPKPAPIKRKNSNTAERRNSSKKPKYTSIKSSENAVPASLSIVSPKNSTSAAPADTGSGDDPFIFDEPDTISPPSSKMPSAAGNRNKLLSPTHDKSQSQPIAKASGKSPTRRTSSSSSQKAKSSKSSQSTENQQIVFEIQKLNSSCNIKKENICVVCEKGNDCVAELGDVVTCTGGCFNSYHTVCGRISDKETFKCTECSTGQHQCFRCKGADSSVKKCSHKDCGKYYHPRCIESHPLGRNVDGKIVCPRHACASCARGNANQAQACIGRLYKCIRCPSAFHVGDFCIAAGSVVLGGLYIVCGDHFQKEKQNKSHQHINTNWCFTCSTGGSLVCCESCPASFHKECLPTEHVPENDVWHCNDCRCGVRPRYGDIVWVKLGSFRWWPSEICHPQHVPVNIQQKNHGIGEFAVHFLGSNDYYWMHRGRVFAYQEGDKGSKESASAKNLDKMFRNALVEAAAGYSLLTTIRENKDQKIAMKCDSKPRKYKYIKINLPIPPVTLNKTDIDNIHVCECRPDMENPCGDDSVCLNRMLWCECHPATCPAGNRCQNQRMQRRSYPKQEPFRTGDERGWGLKAKVDIRKGELVNEYVGELITDEECQRRIKKYHSENTTTFYMLTLDSNRVLDAGPKGNLARFANHSCQPNMQTQKWQVNSNYRIGLFAVEDILAGTELTFNYNLVSVGEKKLKCLCKAPLCSGFIGERSVKPQNNNEKPAPKPKKPKKRQPS